MQLSYFKLNTVVIWKRPDLKTSGIGKITRIDKDIRTGDRSFLIEDCAIRYNFTIHENYTDNSLHKIEPLWLQIGDGVTWVGLAHKYYGRVSKFSAYGKEVKVEIGWVDLDEPDGTTKYKSYFLHYERLLQNLIFTYEE